MNKNLGNFGLLLLHFTWRLLKQGESSVFQSEKHGSLKGLWWLLIWLILIYCRFGSYSRTLQPGVSFILPFIENVKAVKNISLNSMGFICNDVQTKDGKVVDAYGVCIFKVADAKTVCWLDSSYNDIISSLLILLMLKQTRQIVNELLHVFYAKRYQTWLHHPLDHLPQNLKKN